MIKEIFLKRKPVWWLSRRTEIFCCFHGSEEVQIWQKSQ